MKSMPRSQVGSKLNSMKTLPSQRILPGVTKGKPCKPDLSLNTASSHVDSPAKEFYEQCTGKRAYTDPAILQALKKEHPDLALTIVPADSFESGGSDLLAYAEAGFAKITTFESKPEDILMFPIKYREFLPSARRNDPSDGTFSDSLKFGKFLYEWESHEFLLYFVDGRDIGSYYPVIPNYYLLGKQREACDELIRAASLYANALHGEVWVFDEGRWQRNSELYDSIMRSRWEDVILPDEMKKALRDDVQRFFDSREKYDKLNIAWKRGMIFYGPAGNGKTVSIKAMMHELYSRQDSIPSLYVKSFFNMWSIDLVFEKARATAPCYLIFEDLDSLFPEDWRSYFLNAVDGIQSNDGILMVGTTNYIERLDPGISKRPSRFDRKYEFPKPAFEGRVRYAEYWRHKLEGNEDIEFPKELCKKIAEITYDFSFAYIQEAFVASLLAIAAEAKQIDTTSDDGVLVNRDHFDNLRLWVELKKQVKSLREQM